MNSLELEDISCIANLDYNWNKLKNKSLLISGGTGFIGSFLINVIKYRNDNYNDNIKVISLSRRGGENDKNITYLKCDITNPIDYSEHVDYILHLASNTHPKQYGEDPVGTITTNVLGCINLLDLCKRVNADRFLLASSVEIYGDGSIEPMKEDYCGYIDCNNARSGYNESKRVCESLCQSYRQQYGVDIVIARLARVFGADKKEDSKAMAQFINKAVNGEDIILKSKGLQRYSYVYVADAASGILKILLNGVNGETYNISGDDEGKTLGDYAQFIASLANRKVIYNVEDNANVSKSINAILNTEKLKKLNWLSQYQISESLKRTYEILVNK